MTFLDELHTLEHQLLETVCRVLGYDPARVTSVRLTHRRAIVVATDEFGQLRRIEHRVGA